MEDRLVFVIGSPRSGSTLLQRMMGSHSQIFTHPEPHLITPLAHLGFYFNVDKAPYDHINSAKALHEFVEGLPGGEKDYLDACRAYTDTLYGRMLQTSTRKYFMDKTPAYALVLPFLAKVYPKAHYVVLTRHPLAVSSSYAESFFDGDFERAHAFNPILERYVPAIAAFVRANEVPQVLVRYEDLVESPEEHLKRIFEFLGLEHEPGAIEYGQHKHIKKSFGDPKVDDHSRPVTDSLEKWASALANNPPALELSRRVIESLDPADLGTWGYPKETIFDPLSRAGAPPKKEGKWLLNPYRLQRKVLLALRKNIHRNTFGRAVKKVRYVCDVLLRD